MRGAIRGWDPRRAGFVAAVAGALVAVQACGGDPAEEVATAEADRGDDVVVIRMFDDNTFEPEHPEIEVGDTVVWVNEGAFPHNAVGEPGRSRDEANVALPDGAEPFDSGTLGEAEEFSHVFEVPGEYAYVCTFHETMGMIGRVTVHP